MSYPSNLPQVSIVFIFVNEALSVILRSIHSAMNRTPHHLLKEIILVDDNSNNGRFTHSTTRLTCLLVVLCLPLMRSIGVTTSCETGTHLSCGNNNNFLLVFSCVGLASSQCGAHSVNY